MGLLPAVAPPFVSGDVFTCAVMQQHKKRYDYVIAHSDVQAAAKRVAS
jgi:hypothetical protein